MNEILAGAAYRVIENYRQTGFDPEKSTDSAVRLALAYLEDNSLIKAHTMMAVISEACSSLELDSDHKEALRRIVRMVAYSFSGAGGDPDGWLAEFLEKRQYPANLLGEAE